MTTIDTRDFGRMELDENEFIDFRSPIYGYEHLKRFALLSDDEAGEGLVWLQSVDQPDVCFILIGPEVLGIEYEPVLPEEASTLLALEGSSPVYQLITVVPEDFKNTTVNLKSPIVINPANRFAAQVILDTDYPIRMPLFAGKEDEGC